MEDTTADLFLAMSITFAIFGISYHYLGIRYKERMAIVEKGLPKDFFKGSINYLSFLLLLGIVSMGIAFGIITGGFLESLEIAGVDGYMLPFAIFLYLGASLVVSYFVLKKISKGSND